MARHLTNKDIDNIIALLDGWQDKLTWADVCNASESFLGCKYARQTLMKYCRIEIAFNECKKRLKESIKKIKAPSMSLQAAIDRITRVESENERLKTENMVLLQQFVIWQNNAFLKGLSDYDLNRPLLELTRN